MGYYGVSNIVGGHEQYVAEANAPKHKSQMDKDDFLKLLVAQLNHQDPLNPMEDTEMTGQLAEYSSLEQLTNVNTTLDTMLEQTAKDQMTTAVSFIGKSVSAKGYNVTKEGDQVSTITYNLGEAVTQLKVNIYDESGDIVRTDLLGSKEPGIFEYAWDGKDDSGNIVADGTYSVGMLGEDVDGQQVMVQTEVSGEVTGVVAEESGYYLRLKDGRYVNFNFVTEVVSESKIDGGEDPGGESDGDGENNDEENGDETDTGDESGNTDDTGTGA
ncbi:MAG: flagellar hook capping FlgD N-terminal domain-containing protein [Desulfovibrio sp.]|jgi:flagellar basal-body rod modification protein FlgD|nr:flagellar hook capping FlgD N-terminal domain-containing protein [Desulfovibrio sp.]